MSYIKIFQNFSDINVRLKKFNTDLNMLITEKQGIEYRLTENNYEHTDNLIQLDVINDKIETVKTNIQSDSDYESLLKDQIISFFKQYPQLDNQIILSFDGIRKAISFRNGNIVITATS